MTNKPTRPTTKDIAAKTLPNIPGTMTVEDVKTFGAEVALARPGQPDELAPAYVFLASDDASFMTGALVEVTGGKMSSS